MTSSRLLLRSLPGALVGVCIATLASCEARSNGEPLIVVEAWGRPSGEGTDAAAYVSLVNADTAPVRITSVSSPWAKVVEMHETSLTGDVSQMVPRDSVKLISRGPLVMEPGGLHVMLREIEKAMNKGDTVPITFALSSGRSMTVNVTVKAP